MSEQRQVEITDEHSAAGAIAGILDSYGDDEPEGDAAETTESQPEQGQDAGPGESQATGDETGETEPTEQAEPAPSAIEPPQSWSAEDRAVFAKLPPEAQAIVQRRESERDRLIQTRTQEIADERKAHAAEREAMTTQRSHYLNSLQQLAAIVLPEAQALAQVNWQQLAQDNPSEYVRLAAQRDGLRERVNAIGAQMQQAQADQQAEQQKLATTLVAEQKKLLSIKIPDFADPDKGKALAADLSKWLGSQGFGDAEIGQVVDHRLIAVAHKAMLYDKAEAARAAADTKRVQPKAPVLQKPGAAGAPDENTADRRVREKGNALRRTGSMRDASLLLEELL